MSLPNYSAIKEVINRQLVKNAVDCTYYVAFGSVMRDEIAKTYDISANEARKLIDSVAVKLTEGFKDEYLDSRDWLSSL